jgi:serine/threonine-protein kinase
MMTAAPALPALPKALGRYRIQSEIGRGSMGVVYKAEDPVLGRTVALKVIRPAFPVAEDELALEQRFLREASLAAGLSHPNIVVVHDVGRDAQECTPFIALEYLEGRTLAEVLARRESLDWRVAARMVAGLAEALQHAHGNGVVHRDVKPANIMILPSGQAKILDFGVAKASNAHLTNPGEVWGTPFYMSPEQVTGEAADGRSDLFSLGAVLYEVLTGRRAFDGEGVAQVIHGLLHEDPAPPSRVNAALPRALDAVVARALAKDLQERYPDGMAFAEDLDAVLHSRPLRKRGLARPVAAARDPLAPVPWPRFSRAAARALNLALGAALGVGAVGWLGASTGTVETAPPITRPARIEASPLAPVPPTTLAPEPRVDAVTPLVPSPPPTPEPARVAIALEHGLKQGRVKVWVDDRIALDVALPAAAASRSLLFFSKRRGIFTEVLEVDPGERSVRFEVEGDGEKRSGLLRGVLRSDQTRLLAVKVGGSLSVSWKS